MITCRVVKVFIVKDGGNHCRLNLSVLYGYWKLKLEMTSAYCTKTPPEATLRALLQVIQKAYAKIVHLHFGVGHTLKFTCLISGQGKLFAL